ncbi:MAG: DUF4474 domain-containing protein [Clostridia bacterium]|nr:DUF4474 domain-containing protein [Clostridia bacterium]
MKKLFSLVLALVMLITAVPFGALTASAVDKEDLVLGDGNGDGKMTALDARIVLQIAAGLIEPTEEQMITLDYNKDAQVTALDARKILRAVAGLQDYATTTNEILGLFGYKYDPVQNIYYTSVDAWQRNFGFAGIYDNAAAYATMLYKTLKIDFEYDGLDWRLQWWKGQYGVLEGAELGIYTKKPENKDFAFYKCADDDNMLEMQFDFYHSVNDYNEQNPLFTRYEQEHWWITGFKFGVCNPTSIVVKATIFVKPEETGMADGIEKGLQNLTGKDNKPSGEGFTEYKPWTEVTGYDYYVRDKLPDGTHVFNVIWKDAGYLNF